MIVENFDFNTEIEKGNLLTINQVCGILDTSSQTIYGWYAWYNNDEFIKPENTPELPNFIQAKRYTKRFWYKEDIEKLKEFKKFIGRGRAGKMGEYNAKKWQERGVRANENRKINKVFK